MNNHATIAKVQYLDQSRFVVEVQPMIVNEGTYYVAQRMKHGEWVIIPSGGNCRLRLTREDAEQDLIKHAEFMGWERVPV